jgi:hypothetical protein
MECFNHQEAQAVGICKSCFKAVCRNCAVELKNGLACSEECATDVNEYNQMNEKGKIIYGIGNRKSKIPATGVILWSFLSLAMWSMFIYAYVMSGNIVFETLIMGIIFTVVTGFVYYSSKRTGLQC